MSEDDRPTRACSTCGAESHDQGSCNVSSEADKCSVCGFRGHDKRSCPRK
jgi:hypothetical protein